MLFVQKARGSKQAERATQEVVQDANNIETRYEYGKRSKAKNGAGSRGDEDGEMRTVWTVDSRRMQCRCSCSRSGGSLVVGGEGGVCTEYSYQESGQGIRKYSNGRVAVMMLRKWWWRVVSCGGSCPLRIE